MLLQADDNPETRRRLITLYSYLGEPAKSIPHAQALTKDATDPDELEWPVRLALQAGDVDRALDLLEELAASGDDAYWRERIIRFARQDLRVELVRSRNEITGMSPFNSTHLPPPSTLKNTPNSVAANSRSALT